MIKKYDLKEKTGGFKNRLFKMRLLCGIWTGKALITLTRILGRGGTTLPGRAALKIEPRLSSALVEGLAEGSLIITGTNGKTTTAALLTGILQESGLKCIHNQSGSNMSWGVASALIKSVTVSSRLPGDCAVMEVDEGAFPGEVKSLKPRGIIVTNVFRDQLDRYGEIDRIRDSISKGLADQPEGGFQVINADDPSLAVLETAADKTRWTYGLEIEPPQDSFQNTGRDIKACPRCLHQLSYDKIYFAHLGHFHCPNCSYRRPQPDVKMTSCHLNKDGTSQLQITLPEEVIEVKFHLPGTFNLYNLLAAVTCAQAMAISQDVIAEALGKAAPSFGRMERFAVDGKMVQMALIKNPVGANEVLRTIIKRPDKINLLVAINDKIADGTDISWLWDVDFEQLEKVRAKLSTVAVTGLRAWEMAVRFKYAGLDPAVVRIEEKTGPALNKALEQTSPGETLFILPTYTAMIELRRHLNRMGLGKPYWEE